MNPLSNFGEAMSGALCGAFAASFGCVAGYKGGKYLAERALKNIYGNDFEPKKQSLRAQLITTGIGGGIGAIVGGIFAGLSVAVATSEFLIWRAKKY